jgi:hypothetical protein
VRQVKTSIKNSIFFTIIASITVLSMVLANEQFILKLIFTYFIILEAFLLIVALVLPKSLIIKYFIKDKSINEKGDVKRVRTFHFIFFFIFLPEFYILILNNSKTGVIYTIVVLILYMISASLINGKSREDKKNL